MTIGLPRLPKRVGQGLRAGLALVAAVATGIALAPSASAGDLFNEAFDGGATPPGRYRYVAIPGTQHCLTAATTTVEGSLPACASGPIDPPGQGVYRLTGNDHQWASGILLDEPIEADRGVTIEFDFYMYDSVLYEERPGDGLSFFITDATTPVTKPGKPGGALGYNGLESAFVGVGFDQFGNFSTEKWGGKGGAGPDGQELRPNSLVLRGAESTGWGYIDGVTLPTNLGEPSSKTRLPAKRHVVIDISSKNIMDVYLRWDEGGTLSKYLGDINLNTLPNQPPLPKRLNFGFAASTGDATSIYEISGLKIRSLDADLRIAVSPNGPFKAGGTGGYTLNVSSNPSYGYADYPTQVVYDLPAGIRPTAAGGTGWTCAVAGQRVTCDRPGQALAPGGSFPPITVDVAIANDASGALTARAEVIQVSDVPGGVEINPADNVATSTVEIRVDGMLDITLTSKPNPYAAGKPFIYTLTVTNTGATPVNGAKITADWPTSWDQVPWTCTSAGDTCPAASGVGDLNQAINLAAGASITFKVACIMPPQPYAGGGGRTVTATAAVVADGTNCPVGRPCTVRDINGPAG